MSVPHTGQFIVITRKITLDHYILYLYLIKKVPFYRYSNFFHPIAFSHPLKQIKFLTFYGQFRLLCSSFKFLQPKVLLLNPFKGCLNLIYLTGFVVQHRRIRTSSVPLFVIYFLSLAVSFKVYLHRNQ